MSNRIKQIVLVAVMALFLLCMTLWCWLKPAGVYSSAERRELQQFPAASVEDILSGKFMSEFEEYALDQFPARDGFRSLKALSVRYLYGQKDNNGIYLVDGSLSKLEYPLDETSLSRAAAIFQNIYERCLNREDIRAYFSIIPDKNYFLAAENGYPALDYDTLVERMREQTPFLEYIDIFPCLTLEDYYRTDSHWRQEKLLDVARTLANAMGINLTEQYAVNLADESFYGVYSGQSALPLEGEELLYLTNDLLENCVVYDHENDREIGIYDLEKAAGEDPYALFLSGSLSLITIENPNAVTDRELIIFRDSFGSSIAPLLVEGYAKVTLVDIRYLASQRLGDFLEFENQDVLFLYSTGVLNNSETLK